MQSKVAFIGAGSMAREHAKAFADIAGVELVGVTSRTRAKADSFAADFGMPVVADSVAELYERTRADLVVNTASFSAMFDTSLESFAHPWAVLLEKPPGIDLPQAEALLAARQERVWVALNRRQYSGTLAAREDLDSRPDPRLIVVQDQQNVQAMIDFRYSKAEALQTMYWNSIHLVDHLVLFGRGEVVDVRTSGWSEDTRFLTAEVTWSSGDRGVYIAVWDGPSPWSVSVQDAQSRWEMRPLEQATLQKRGERARAEIPVSEWDKQFKAGFRRQAEQTVLAMAGGDADIPTLGDALETMRLIQRIYGK